MPRPEFTRKTKAAAFLRCNGLCEGKGCGARLKAGEAEYDHVLPAELGGDASLGNCQVLCRPCHKGKTAADVGRIRKADRQRDRASGALRGKPFPRRPKQQCEKRDQLPLPARHPGHLMLWAAGRGDTE